MEHSHSTASQWQAPNRANDQVSAGLPKPRGRPRKNPSPAQASAHADIPTVVPTAKPAGRQVPQPQASSSRSDAGGADSEPPFKRSRQAQDAVAAAAAASQGQAPAAAGLVFQHPSNIPAAAAAAAANGLDLSHTYGDEEGEQQLPAKRKRNLLFSVKDVMRATEGPTGPTGSLPPRTNTGPRSRSGSTPHKGPLGGATASSSMGLGGDATAAAAEQGARELAVHQERRRLVEAVRFALGPESLAPETNVATLVQRILKCGVLAGCGVEYRKRSKGMGPDNYNRGVITQTGLIRCGCHNQDLTMSEFEQHSNSQIHRPAEYIFVRCMDLSLKGFAQLVLSSNADSSSTGCCICGRAGHLLCCSACPATMHARCAGLQGPPAGDMEWLCPACLQAGIVPKPVSGFMTTRATSAAAAAAAAAAATATGQGWSRKGTNGFPCSSSGGSKGGGHTEQQQQQQQQAVAAAAAAMFAAAAANGQLLLPEHPGVMLAGRMAMGGSGGSTAEPMGYTEDGRLVGRGGFGAAAAGETGYCESVDMLQRTGSNGLPSGVQGHPVGLPAAAAAAAAAGGPPAGGAQVDGSVVAPSDGSPRSGTATSNPADGLDRKASTNIAPCGQDTGGGGGGGIKLEHQGHGLEAAAAGSGRGGGGSGRVSSPGSEEPEPAALPHHSSGGGHLHMAASTGGMLLSTEERVVRVQACLMNYSALMTGVLSATNLVEAQRRASQAGAQLLHTLQQLL